MAKKMHVRVNIDRVKIKSAIASGGKRGTWMALDHLAAVSKEQVPLDQGPLKNSCFVDVAEDGASGTVSYDTPYAVRQHEETGYHHQRGRKAKYLEDPANDRAVQREMIQLMQRGMSETMGG